MDVKIVVTNYEMIKSSSGHIKHLPSNINNCVGDKNYHGVRALPPLLLPQLSLMLPLPCHCCCRVLLAAALATVTVHTPVTSPCHCHHLMHLKLNNQPITANFGAVITRSIILLHFHYFNVDITVLSKEPQ